MRVDTPASNQPDRGPQGPSGPQPDRGGMRLDAVWRILIGGLYLLLFLAIIGPILLVTGLVLGTIDVLWQLVLGSEGIAPDNLFRDAWMAQLQNVTWVLTGEGEFQLTIFG